MRTQGNPTTATPAANMKTKMRITWGWKMLCCVNDNIDQDHPWWWWTMLFWVIITMMISTNDHPWCWYWPWSSWYWWRQSWYWPLPKMQGRVLSYNYVDDIDKWPSLMILMKTEMILTIAQDARTSGTTPASRSFTRAPTWNQKDKDNLIYFIFPLYNQYI